MITSSIIYTIKDNKYDFSIKHEYDKTNMNNRASDKHIPKKSLSSAVL